MNGKSKFEYDVFPSYDSADLHGVEFKALNQQVRRNQDRFPADFMFQLNDEEWAALRSQIVTLNTGRRRHRKYAPDVSTQDGGGVFPPLISHAGNATRLLTTQPHAEHS